MVTDGLVCFVSTKILYLPNNLIVFFFGLLGFLCLLLLLGRRFHYLLDHGFFGRHELVVGLWLGCRLLQNVLEHDIFGKSFVRLSLFLLLLFGGRRRGNGAAWFLFAKDAVSATTSNKDEYNDSEKGKIKLVVVVVVVIDARHGGLVLLLLPGVATSRRRRLIVCHYYLRSGCRSHNADDAILLDHNDLADGLLACLERQRMTIG